MQNSQEEQFRLIAKEITTDLGKLLVTRPYVAIIDMLGYVHYFDEPLEQFLEFTQNFVKSNFNLLEVGDHSLPLGGVNLAFFKASSKAMIVMYTVKGLTGQLLAFKAKMFEWTERIEALLGDLEFPAPAIPTETTTIGVVSEPEVAAAPPRPKKRGMKTVPFLTKQLSGKEKFSIDVAQILQLCNGDNTVQDICDETGYPLLKINDIIRTYQKKKWIALKRIV